MDELKGITIPPKPQLLLDIEAAQGNLSVMANLISTDASVSAAVLKAVNSPFYRRAVPITSIQRAVVMLGEQPITQLVKGLVLKTAVQGQLPKKWFEWYWRDSSASALLTTSLCQALMLPIKDVAYCLGLFHNCGAPLMAQRFPTYISELPTNWQSVTRSITDIEETVYGVSHASVGRMVAKHWKLPPSLIQAISRHHQPIDDSLTTLLDSETLTLLCVLQWANFLGREYFTSGGLDYSPEWLVQARPALEYLDLTDEDWFDISQETLSDLYDQHVYEEGESPNFLEDTSWLTLPDDCTATTSAPANTG